MEVRLRCTSIFYPHPHLRPMSFVTVYMSTAEGVLELMQNAVRITRDDEMLVIVDDVGERLEFRNVRIKEVNLLSGNIVLEKEPGQQ